MIWAYLNVRLETGSGPLPRVAEVGIYSSPPTLLTVSPGVAYAELMRAEGPRFAEAKQLLLQIVSMHPGLKWALPWLEGPAVEPVSREQIARATAQGVRNKPPEESGEMVVWSAPGCDQSDDPSGDNCKGWHHMVSLTYGREIQACDEAGIFPDDEAAKAAHDLSCGCTWETSTVTCDECRCIIYEDDGDGILIHDEAREEGGRLLCEDCAKPG